MTVQTDQLKGQGRGILGVAFPAALPGCQFPEATTGEPSFIARWNCFSPLPCCSRQLRRS